MDEDKHQLLTVPADVLPLVLKHILSAKDLCAAAQVSHLWKANAYANDLWRRLFEAS
jgi:hypothetical protein